LEFAGAWLNQPPNHPVGFVEWLCNITVSWFIQVSEKGVINHALTELFEH
jgi:hypothetical protein